MDKEALVRWKSQIFDYQQRVRKSKPATQGTLFDIAPTHCDPDSIDPFSLRLNTMQFWRMPADSPGYPCIYFVIETILCRYCCMLASPASLISAGKAYTIVNGTWRSTTTCTVSMGWRELCPLLSGLILRLTERQG